MALTQFVNDLLDDLAPSESDDFLNISILKEIK